MSTDNSGVITQDISGANTGDITNPNVQSQPIPSTESITDLSGAPIGQPEAEEQQILDGILQDLHNLRSPPWRQ